MSIDPKEFEKTLMQLAHDGRFDAACDILHRAIGMQWIVFQDEKTQRFLCLQTSVPLDNPHRAALILRRAMGLPEWDKDVYVTKDTKLQINGHVVTDENIAKLTYRDISEAFRQKSDRGPGLS